MLRLIIGSVLAGTFLTLGSCAPGLETDPVQLDHIGLSAECDRLPSAEVATALLGVGTRSSIADITGYHDCQPLVRVAGSRANPDWSYGPITKIWAVRQLGTYTEEDFESAPPPGLPVAVITMEESQQGYTELGIEEDEQCLYLRNGGTEWSASVAQCDIDGGAPVDSSVPLRVFRDQSTGVNPEEYPPVVKWGWDHVRMLPYIGVRCGAGWCDIGPGEFRPSPHGCGGRAKGYCDEQILAIERGGVLVPAPGMLAVLQPVPGVHQLEVDDFQSWIEVATVRIPGAGDSTYIRKFNYHRGVNRVHFRHVGEDPAVGWEAMIVSPSAQDTAYRQVVLNPHAGANLPGTARWAWTSGDESSWVPCPTGCCYPTDQPTSL